MQQGLRIRQSKIPGQRASGAARTALARLAMIVLLASPASGADTAGSVSGGRDTSVLAATSGIAIPEPLAPRVSTSFPLRIAPTKRHLIDAAGTPFLLHGDSPWSLIVQLKREEVDEYLDDRAARGFNTLLINVIEHQFARTPPANAYGERPFTRAGDFGSPNEAYFAHVDWVVERAASKGFLLLLVPALAGYGGGSQGWYQQMVRSGPAKMRAYGRFLGQRYAKFPNIMWVHGGDYNPPDRTPANEIVAGIREHDRRALHTAHAAPETAAAEFWGGEGWLDINNVYTYGDVHAKSLQEYARAGPMPFFFIEGRYENEANDGHEQRMRMQAYQALLSGAMGHVFGNNPIWHFDGPGLYPARTKWRGALDGPGSRSMAHVFTLFAARQWWTLVPDAHNRLLTQSGQGTEHRAVAARASDGSFALAYLPSGRAVVVDLAQLSGPGVRTNWYDPASGAYQPAIGSPLPTPTERTFRPPGPNASGFGDWVLVLESAR